MWEEKPVAVKTCDSKLMNVCCKRSGADMLAIGAGRPVAELICIQHVIGHFWSC